MKHKIIHDGAWVTVGQVVSALGALASVRILTEILSPDAFGLFALSIGGTALLQSLFCTPLLQAYLRFFPDFNSAQTISQLDRSAKRMVMHRAGFLFATCLVAGLAVRSLFSMSITLVVLLSLYLAFEMWRSYETNVFNAARRQKEFAVLSGADACLKPALALVFVSATNAGVESVLGGFVVGSLVLAISALFVDRGI